MISGDGFEYMSNHDVIIEWLAENGFRPYIHESGSYRAWLGEHMLNFNVYDDRYSFFIMVPLMSWHEYEESDKTSVLELTNGMNIKLLGTSIRACGIGAFFSLWLNNTFDTQSSMVYSLGAQLNDLAVFAEQWKSEWNRSK